MISDSGKMIIGHNCFLDILHTIEKFRGPLPSSSEEFKEAVTEMFPRYIVILFDPHLRIVDTKHILETHEGLKELFASTGLGDAYKRVREPPFDFPSISLFLCILIKEFEKSFNRYKSEEFLHEAGYDAYVTGFLFVRLAHHLLSCKVFNTSYLEQKE